MFLSNCFILLFISFYKWLRSKYIWFMLLISALTYALSAGSFFGFMGYFCMTWHIYVYIMFHSCSSAVKAVIEFCYILHYFFTYYKSSSRLSNSNRALLFLSLSNTSLFRYKSAVSACFSFWVSPTLLSIWLNLAYKLCILHTLSITHQSHR